MEKETLKETETKQLICVILRQFRWSTYSQQIDRRTGRQADMQQNQ